MRLDRAAILIKRASLKFDRISNSVLGKYNLTTGQYKVMMYVLSKGEKGVRTADIDYYLAMSHQTTIGILRNLQKKGLIVYKPNPQDARSRLIKPTKEAYDEKEELEDAGEQLEDELTQSLTKEERKQLIQLLRKLMDIQEDM